MTQFIHQPHDKLFKQSMADIRVARDFFEAHLPPDVLKRVDLNTLRLEKQTFIDEAYKATEADIVYSVKMGDSLAYFYILCEHQTSIDYLIAFRLLIYIVRIIETHLQQHPNDPLPVICPLVVYTGEKKWDAPLDIFELFGENQELARQLLLQPYQLIDVQRISDEELRQHLLSGLFEYVLKYRHQRDFEKFLDVFFSWLNQVEGLQQGSSFVKFVLEYVMDGVGRKNAKLFVQRAIHLSEPLRGKVMSLAQCYEEIGMKKGIEQGRAEAKTLAQRFEEIGIKKGIEKGLQKGQTETKQAIAQELLQRGMSVEMVSEVTKLSVQELEVFI